MDFQDYMEDSYQRGEEAGYQKGEEAGYQRGEEAGYQKGEEAGYQKGEEAESIRHIKSLMKNADMDLNQAMKILEIPPEKYESILAAIQEME